MFSIAGGPGVVEQSKETVRHVYRYRNSVVGMPVLGAGISLVMAALGILLAQRIHTYELDVASAVFVIAGAVLLIVRPIQLADIVVSEGGIGACRFLRRWKFVAWHDVKRVLNVRYRDPASGQTINNIFVDDSNAKRSWLIRKMTSNLHSGSISFDSRILGFQELQRLLEEKCGRSAVRFVFCDKTAGRHG